MNEEYQLNVNHRDIKELRSGKVCFKLDDNNKQILIITYDMKSWWREFLGLPTVFKWKCYSYSRLDWWNTDFDKQWCWCCDVQGQYLNSNDHKRIIYKLQELARRRLENRHFL